MSVPKRVHVAVAVIVRETDQGRQILLAKRKADAHQGNLWEFPGGKVEANEGVQSALVRELEEELGIVAQPDFEPLIRIHHDYSDKLVLLDVWIVRHFEGVPHGREGQAIEWVSVDELTQYEFPEANRPIIDAVRLPRRYLITPSFDDYSSLANYINAAKGEGFRLIQLRQHHLSNMQYADWAKRIYAEHFAQGDFTLLLNRSYSELRSLKELSLAGWHLGSAALQEYLSTPRDLTPPLLGVSCHSFSELSQAMEIGANYALLSPVQPTQTHPRAEAMGFEAFHELAEKAKIPVYGLGGLTPSHQQKIFALGGQGVAAIRGWAQSIQGVI